MSDFQPVAPFKVARAQTPVAYTGTAAASAAVGVGINVVRITTTTAAFIAFGSAPTATVNDIPMQAGVAEYFLVSPNSKVSAVQVAAGGNLSVVECTK